MKRQIRISLRWPIHIINSVDQTKLSIQRWLCCCVKLYLGQYETFIFGMVLDYIFLLAYYEIYSYVCFLMQVSEITITLTLLLILLYLDTDATMRPEVLHCGLIISPFVFWLEIRTMVRPNSPDVPERYHLV